jgi:hypothetical protein
MSINKIQRMSPSQASLLSHYRLVRLYMYNVHIRLRLEGIYIPHLRFQSSPCNVGTRVYSYLICGSTNMVIYQYLGINRSNLSKYGTQPDTTVYLSIGNEYGLWDRYNRRTIYVGTR